MVDEVMERTWRDDGLKGMMNGYNKRSAEGSLNTKLVDLKDITHQEMDKALNSPTQTAKYSSNVLVEQLSLDLVTGPVGIAKASKASSGSSCSSSATSSSSCFLVQVPSNLLHNHIRIICERDHRLN
ncbi:unnamed protein product [Microthlaspi erraticum]|uniref:Uncharacterized protein n=1 Tax=Microthlaspi erraticum TaxID=1685480 RepID=A0A6D2HNK0_9BRAS|nr:unnamed protein product [Microthlaspi erraticum]